MNTFNISCGSLTNVGNRTLNEPLTRVVEDYNTPVQTGEEVSVQDKTAEEETEMIEVVELRDELTEKLRTDYGVVSGEEFVTCLGADVQVYPDSAFGFVNAVYEDIDNDGIDDVVAAIAKKTGEYSGEIIISIYKFDGINYRQTCSQKVTDVDFCTQQRIALFYGVDLGYGIVVDKAFWGSYTRAYGKIGEVYSISDAGDKIQLIDSCEYNNIENEDDSHIEHLLKEYGVPYAENCASYNEGADKLLCTIEHRNVDDFEWVNLQNYLTIKN